MITPVMYLLSGYNERYVYENKISLAYMPNRDMDIIRDEADKISRNLHDEMKTNLDELVNGDLIVSSSQFVNGSMIDIHPLSALLLNRLRDCSVSKTMKDSVDDLSVNHLLLRIEGNQNYVYVYVLEIMNSLDLDYNAKVLKIKELYDMLERLQYKEDVDIQYGAENRQRLELHSSSNYWVKMLISDYLMYYHTVPEVPKNIMSILQKDLKTMGYAGFVNPLKMYEDYANTRMVRKTNVNVDDAIIQYLQKIVLSGGVNL